MVNVVVYVRNKNIDEAITIFSRKCREEKVLKIFIDKQAFKNKKQKRSEKEFASLKRYDRK